MTVNRKKSVMTEQKHANLDNVPMTKVEAINLLMELKDANKKIRGHLYHLAISGVHKTMGYSSVNEMFKFSLTNMSVKEAHKEVARGKIEIVISNGNIDKVGTHRGAQLDAFYSGGYLNKVKGFDCFIEKVNAIHDEAKSIKKELGDKKLGSKHFRLSVIRVFDDIDISNKLKSTTVKSKKQKREAAIETVSKLSKEFNSIRILKKLRSILNVRIKDIRLANEPRLDLD